MWCVLMCVLVALSSFNNVHAQVAESQGGLSHMTDGATFPTESPTPVLKLTDAPPVAEAGQDNFDPKNFPSDPPQPLPSATPPPLAPSGRWLHTMVLVEGRLYVYGGVGSYSTTLYNDLWIYDFGAGSWDQLQANFVPPFPAMQHPKGPVGDIAEFRASDTPPAPALRDDPGRTMVEVPLDPNKKPGDPVAVQPKQEPLRVEELVPIPVDAVKPVGYSFLEVGMTMLRNMWSPQTADAETARSVPASSAPSPVLVEEDEDDEDEDEDEFAPLALLETGSRSKAGARARLRTRTRTAVAARHRTLLEMHMGGNPPDGTGMQGGAMNGGNPSPANTPPAFHKPGTGLSPFIVADLWQYDLDTNGWKLMKTKSPNVPAPRWLHTSVSINKRMIVFGGVSYADTILGDLWVFNPKDISWMKANPAGKPILPREGHSAVVMNRKEMWVFGGISYGNVPFNDLWVYDASRNQWAEVLGKGLIPPPRWMHSAVSYADERSELMIIFGGVTRSWVPLDDVHVFNKATQTWEAPLGTGYPPFPRYLHAAGVLHNKMFILGGMANNIPLEDVWIYDIDDRTWQEENPIGPWPFAREGHDCDVVRPAFPKVKPQPRPPYFPPDPVAEGMDPLMPMMKNFTTPRPLNRFRKDFSVNRFWICFGGAGPKPK